MQRGFETSEYKARLARAQALMADAGLGALLLMSEPEVRYFTGFLTRFWESPSRPWFLVVPAVGDPIAVIPSIGAALMGQTWLADIRTWAAPNPVDEGVTLLRDTLSEVGGPIGVPSGPETVLRMPLADFERVKAGFDFRGDAGIVAQLRAVKSEAEIDKIRHICAIAGRAFDRVPEFAGVGVPLAQVFRDFQRLLLEEGADWVPYLAGGAGPFGYGDVISPATQAPLQMGDVLMLDTGAVWDGYFCDFDRNFCVGAPHAEIEAAHARLIEATQAGLEAAKPGARACDVYAAMAAVTGAGETAGRLGHGLGMQLTEGVSLASWDRTELQSGMVLTLEPTRDVRPGQGLVHEENIVIRPGGAEKLSPWVTRLPHL
ncbi:MAG: M24 family metallopeptidase [Thalassovita sp.]